MCRYVIESSESLATDTSGVYSSIYNRLHRVPEPHYDEITTLPDTLLESYLPLDGAHYAEQCARDEESGYLQVNHTYETMLNPNL